MRRGAKLAVAAAAALLAAAPAAQARPVWTKAQAAAWYARQPWPIGVNYVPADAINPLEMWQADTFDAATIDKELGWAQALHINTVRVFLHDLLWEQDPEGFTKRIDRFLAIAAKHRIKPMLVLFDSCWDPDPHLGPQRPPIPGVHNSGWVQSPGRAGLEDMADRPRLRAYVEGVVGAFAKDERVLAWDVWNEPDSPGGKAYRPIARKLALVEPLVSQAFAWARAQDPIQPLTSPLFQPGEWPGRAMTSLEKSQIAQSDVLSFHDYGWPESFARSVDAMAAYGRPVLATEYMARGVGSTFDTVLPIAKRRDVGVMSWGFVDGRTQSKYPWDSWTRPYVMEEPVVWFHELLKADGTPYRPAEAALIREMADSPRRVAPAPAYAR